MKIIKKPAFLKAEKKLHANQRQDLEKAILDIVADVQKGQLKSGDLADVRVHKFQMAKQRTLIAYHYEEDVLVLTLIAFGSRENFYRDLKR